MRSIGLDCFKGNSPKYVKATDANTSCNNKIASNGRSRPWRRPGLRALPAWTLVLFAPGGGISLAWLRTVGWGRPGLWPPPPRLEMACVLWHWWIRNSIRGLWKIDFPCGDLTSWFTGKGDQTVLGEVSEQAFWKVFPLFFFFLSFSTICVKGNVWLCWGLHTTSLSPWGLKHWDVHTTTPYTLIPTPPLFPTSVICASLQKI